MKMKVKNIPGKYMKQLAVIWIIPFASFVCAKSPILSDLYNNRITLILKGTYESNSPYDWKTSLYRNDSLLGYSSPLSDVVATQDISLYVDIADIRVAVGNGVPDKNAPEKYWNYFTKERKVLCSNNYANGDTKYKLLSCYNTSGDIHYSEFFSGGTTYTASDIPVNTYNHMAIFFRKIISSPAILYDANYSPTEQTSSFDNRIIHGINLMDSIIQYSASDSKKETALMAPLERKDLSLAIPSGNDSYVIEVRIFLKNLLMKHVIDHSGGDATAGPLTYIGPSDWRENHQNSDLNLAYQNGNNVIFTARVYSPAAVGSIQITDAEALPAYQSYYALVSAGTAFDGSDLPYAATSRVALDTGTTGSIDNLPEGNYDLYKTCDQKMLSASGSITGEDGYPETAVSCATGISVTAGAVTSSSITCTCP